MNLYEEIAKAMPKMTGLRCTVCGYTRHPAQAQIAGFLAAGWPTCCGRTMHMHTDADPLPAEPSTPPAEQEKK